MVQFENVSMAYGQHEVLKSLNLHIGKGQLVVLIGPSGCGKTTTLQLINRLIRPTSGSIFVDGKDISQVDPVELRRGIGYVIQEIGLFPHMTIQQNIEVVPKLLGWDENRRRERTLQLLKLVNMDEKYLKSYPSELSGGQQQRIGLLRALAVEPPIILMDEPFGALDPITRESLQEEIKTLQKKLKKTIVFVTHDMDEALKLADIIVLMKDGEIVQAATPKELLSNPANEFVEQFIGRHRIYGKKADVVADVMSDKVACVTPDLSLVESVELMRQKRVPSLFVVDDEHRLIGQITIEEIRHAHSREDVPVGDVPLFHGPTVTTEESAKDVFDMMMENHLDAVPVLDSESKVVGVVTRSSMVKSLAHVVWRGENG